MNFGVGSCCFGLRAQLIETGEKERLMELLRERLVDCGWKDEMKALCRYFCFLYCHRDFSFVSMHLQEKDFGVLGLFIVNSMLPLIAIFFVHLVKCFIGLSILSRGEIIRM